MCRARVVQGLRPVDRFHRHVQQQLVAGPARFIGLLGEVVRIGHERCGDCPGQPNRLGGADLVEAEIIEHNRNERSTAD